MKKVSFNKNLSPITRRDFLRRAIQLSSVPFVIKNLFSAPPSKILNHASFGASGMAAADIEEFVKSQFVRLVAVAEVDLTRIEHIRKNFPNTKIYQDWRELLDKEHKNIDSVNVTVPDHMHAPMAMAAMELGKHVYCQKPLTHDVYEARRLTEVAKEKKLVTQMGIQIHSERPYRLAVKLIQEGVIGKVLRVYSWSDKQWGDPEPRPNRSDPIPEGFNWDLWLGIAATRPYIGGGYYHPANWRKRLDFGTGTLGDMGCHIFDPVVSALQLKAPLSVRSEGEPPNEHNWSIANEIHYVFPGTKYTAENTLNMVWYDGLRRPPKELEQLIEGDKLPDQGSVFVGTDGTMLLPHYSTPVLYPSSKFADFKYPEVETKNHWLQFVEACTENGQTWAPFEYSGPLTETVLLGTIAARFPKTTLYWDSANLRFSNVAEANVYVRREYREGWQVKGL